MLRRVVVVGAGLAGLSAAVFLERAGVDVLVVERSDSPGGCARAIRGVGYAADLAVSELPTGVEAELVDGIFAHLGVRERCAFEPAGSFYRAVVDGLELDAPLGLEAFAEAHADRFPADADGIRRFVAIADRILRDVHGMPLHLTLDRLDEVAERFPTYFRYSGATLAEVLDELLTDPQAKAMLGATWPQGGLEPERLSFATCAQGLALYARGIVVPQGGLGGVVDALADVLGDRLLLGREAARIAVEDGSVTGIELADGTAIATSSVVAAGDAGRALTELLPPDSLPPRLTRRLARMRPSTSACVVVATADTAALPPLTFCHDAKGARWTSARAGTIVVRALASPQDDAERLVGALAREAENIAPGARVVATLTPADLERLTGNTGGAAFGWENSPQQTGGRRLSIVAPVDGLFLAGHWAQPGHGVYRAILSGMHAAHAVLARSGDADAIPDFRSTPAAADR
jgi:prolycopene isomerase